MSDALLVGAGGHAVAVVEAAILSGFRIAGYVDPVDASWLIEFGNPVRYETDDDALSAMAERGVSVVLGLGGIDAAGLARRLALLDRYVAAGLEAPVVKHPKATVSDLATLCPGVIVLANAVVQPFATIGRGAIVNTGAIVEHHAVLGDGAHAAPGSVVLGSANVGDRAMIGANAVVLPGACIADGGLIKANSIAGKI